ncbi:DNA-directed RNA polymerase subunit delta [Bacillaceae bacterium Marseille-Q3522]|nr:DNA-directed RNA polymerase subunit delta [Bacillaceae bacterium Marseille-Q3522]
MGLDKYTKDQLQEMSLIDIAYELLGSQKQAMSFYDIVDEIAAALGLSKEEVKKKLPQFYTDLNIDGRFLALGDNRWGLRDWFPIEQIEEEVITVVKSKKKKSAKKDLHNDEFDEEEDDNDYSDEEEVEEDLEELEDEDLLGDEEEEEDIDSLEDDLDEAFDEDDYDLDDDDEDDYDEEEEEE